ncbi:unnamed protein product [Microthlaspi erraticum]|uniref:Phorbol-ester/DAG-type domain-containing protein n=1 Tax=Microthlaspi erraticum TaxID=1685480 RepID=A0A6D2IDW0_9BRAS|nr:unnamed protein product [Microthlaspi erraticum]
MNHPLTLLTMPPMHALDPLKKCDKCLRKIDGFNLFCRICNFMIDIRCALKGKDSSWVLKPKVFGALSVNCIRYDHHSHGVVEAIISRAESLHCVICDEELYGKAMACMECQEIYHPWCIEAWRRKIFGHPLHYDHMLQMLEISGSTCTACKLIITNIGYTCSDCKVKFHLKCIQEACVSSKVKSHRHNLYNFWIDDSQLTRACGVCTRPCGASFYGCIGCSFYAHVECLGFPDNVKNQQHQHSVSNTYVNHKGSCSLCGGDSRDWMYTCNHCNDVFHMECIMSTDDREAATEEEQRQDIYLTYLEHDLLKLLKKHSEFKIGSVSLV